MIIVSNAFDKALASLPDSVRPLLNREVMAHRMLDLAAAGELDIPRLCAAVLLKMPT